MPTARCPEWLLQMNTFIITHCLNTVYKPDDEGNTFLYKRKKYHDKNKTEHTGQHCRNIIDHAVHNTGRDKKACKPVEKQTMTFQSIKTPASTAGTAIRAAHFDNVW